MQSAAESAAFTDAITLSTVHFQKQEQTVAGTSALVTGKYEAKVKVKNTQT
jgi:hypothetical protein